MLDGLFVWLVGWLCVCLNVRLRVCFIVYVCFCVCLHVSLCGRGSFVCLFVLLYVCVFVCVFDWSFVRVGW